MSPFLPAVSRRVLGLLLSLVVALAATVVAAPAATAADTTPPTKPEITLERWQRPKEPDFSGYWLWKPRATWSAAQDSHGVTGYHVQLRFPGGRWHTPARGKWRSPDKRHYRVQLEPGHQACFRVRARDAAGNVSRWSKRRCTTAPLTPLMDFQSTALVQDNGASTHEYAYLSTEVGPTRTEAKFTDVRGVRLRVRTGPKAGRATVYVGRQRLGTIDARASTGKWRTIKIRIPREDAHSGRIRFVPRTKAPVKVRFVWPIS
ncbi:fibronectin type III domain-containing protein [Isoptericola haloaureus]|uniref:Fibronectin type III domain-containing protein n=1 Tax=Isoptericola haloaureus TaxID=1542902 RepID=A0ABU7ZB54_9MICO